MKFGNLTDARAVRWNSYADNFDNVVARPVGNALVVSIIVASCQLRLRVAVLVEHFQSFI